eukprot:CAMPEP_0119313612 /NCGR_PEP_ID=MMETSP1333-20130426/29664_1 /TAXON_ID=418940 /ORGANISM="Scyphosphaera apsteinii, Strain RCC1455" /LENGTH=293 /DNA_ID=CAMNT_0007318477 /DNA_START=83 /DNA_END=964 /DNA_ORIENTATION=-
MPLVGIGTWQYNSSTARAEVESALKLGYRHIDTALGYANQDGVGAAIRASTADADIKRRDLFVVSKIPGGLNETASASALELSLSQLFPGDPLAYVDLMLVHFPATWGGSGGKAMRQAQWRAMESFVHKGKSRAIGVSHYCRKHLDDVLAIATIRPAVNQVQYHVGMGTASGNATDDLEYMRKQGVTYESFSPLCGPCGGTDSHALITGKLVTDIGAKYGKSGPQVALKWQVQRGIPVIPKTSNLAHMRENFDLFSWNLTQADMAELTAATVPAVAGNPGPGGVPVSGDCDVD